MPNRTPLIAALLVAAGAVAAWPAAPLAASGDEDAATAVAAAVTRPAQSYRATRMLTAGTATPGSEGWMEVATTYDAARGFSYEVIAEGGSGRMRNRVLRKLLDEEVQASRNGRGVGFALTPASYRLAATGDGVYRVAPTVRDDKRVEGELHVEPDTGYARLEGRLTRSPSFWIRAVALVWHFAQAGDSVVPTRVETLADVRMVGPAWLVMTWHYDEVDGRPAPRRLLERRASTAASLADVFERYVGKRPAAMLEAAAAATSWSAPVARR